MLFDIDCMFETSLAEVFGAEQPARYNVPASRWEAFDRACMFTLTKDQLS